ncbi:MAG: phosphatidate cytidylyltransferase [Rhodospirillales bacterium]
MAPAEDAPKRPSGEDAPKRSRSELAVRVLSSVVIAPPVLAGFWFGGPWFTAICVLTVCITLWEWRGLCTQGAAAGNVRFRPWFTVGAAYVFTVCCMMIFMGAAEGGRDTMLWLILIVWAADIGAYIAGRAIGGPKLAPAVSPNKTWAGFFGAVGAAALCGWLAAWFFIGTPNVIYAALFAAVLGAVSQGGDLMESWAKRRCGAKDSSNLIPGHGGLLDRVDGLMAAAAAMFILTLLHKAPLSS